MTEETQIIEAPESENVLQIIAQVAANPQANPDVMERLLDMQERILDRNAKQAFNADFVACVSNMPAIVKDAQNNQTNSSYAKLETINKALVPHAGKYGFALSFGTADSPLERHVRVTADLIHREGHSRAYFYDCPYDMTGIKGNQNKTETHGKASATTYGQRYLTCLIFDITVMQDDDGNAANSIRPYSDELWDMFVEAIHPDTGSAMMFAAIDAFYKDEVGPMRSRHLEAYRAERKITAESDRMRKLVATGHELAADLAVTLQELIDRDDTYGFDEQWECLKRDEQKLVWGKISPTHRKLIDDHRKAA